MRLNHVFKRTYCKNLLVCTAFGVQVYTGDEIKTHKLFYTINCNARLFFWHTHHDIQGEGLNLAKVKVIIWDMPEDLDLPILLLPFHSSVLEPDLDLPLGQAQRMRNLDSASPGQVAIEVELFLQLQGLVSGVGLATSLPFWP